MTVDTKHTRRSLQLINQSTIAVTTGASIGIDFMGLGASIDQSVAETMTVTNTTEVEYPCGEDTDGGFTCAFLVEPFCVHMKGTCQAGDLGTVPVSAFPVQHMWKRVLARVRLLADRRIFPTAVGSHHAYHQQRRKPAEIWRLRVPRTYAPLRVR